MQINLTGHHVDITEALKGYVDTKFDRLARHFDHVINVHVILSVEKLRQKAEATIHINGAKVFADAVHEDMYAAIDGLIDKLDRQVIKYKEKRQNHRGAGQKAAAEAQLAEGADAEAALAAGALAEGQPS
ncbi:ribosome-associated translation inhibitor RaiA [Thiohalocapsa marina]|uniref:Ribosome hibernation promoting factor n=1 Tax=Thiohalocapsa marina TaxID=424902 RepID=A0A5M8FQH9_9GAMM|nr:ribosome-associated translation inhibitor RaiA [Thiohalocapsa marina]KAA6186036.1 ribosome-associated translation inhibitor RaiA [Thiohalocapsa marina]